MRAVVLHEGQYSLRECPIPQPGATEVLVKVEYAGINRADLMQKQGQYPLPDKIPAIPGMEVSGRVEAFGKDVSGLTRGDTVCGLVVEGAYAEYVCVESSLLMPVPKGFSLQQAAALPEACFTVWISLVWQAHLQPGETVLIHGGTSGIGSMAIQMATQMGARVFATAGSAEKCTLCESLGAEKAIPYRSEDFVAVVKKATHGKGVDIILDMVGGSYFARNLESLGRKGRLTLIAFLQGARMEVNLAPILMKHLSVMGSTLRARPLDEKARIAVELREQLWPLLDQGRITPLIDKVFALEDAQKALDRMDQGLNLGKILLKM
jgi:putative PIG3 family NAD(P)H quinone oxidoreductase